MNGIFYADCQGRHQLSGEIFESEIQNKRWDKQGNPQVYQNHSSADEEIDGMVRFFAMARQMADLGGKGLNGADILEAEQRLQTKLPKEIIALYTALDGEYGIVCNRKNQTLMPPSELYIRDGVLAFAYTGKRKKRHLGIGLQERHLLTEPEPDAEWDYPWCLDAFCEMMIQMVAITAIGRMPERKSYKLRGPEMREICACEAFEAALSPLWKRYDGYFNIWHAILVNEETKSLAWLRPGDIRIGAQDSSVTDVFKALRGEAGYYAETEL